MKPTIVKMNRNLSKYIYPLIGALLIIVGLIIMIDYLIAFFRLVLGILLIVIGLFLVNYESSNFGYRFFRF